MPLEGSAPSAARTSAWGATARSLRIVAILSFACLVFLWQPIFSGGFYAAGDVSGLSRVVRPDGAEPGRLPQIDVTVDVLPWTKFSTDEVRSGHLPTWNPYNNSGVPHLANIQAGVFSPFNVPFYVLPMRLALVVSTYALLMTAGLLTYGLMRHLGASELAGIVSSVGYMFCGFVVFWLRWPLAGVAAFLPGLVWSASALTRAVGWRQVVRRGAVTALAVAAVVVAGHPETAFFGAMLTVLWCLTMLVRRRLGVAGTCTRIAQLAVAALVGLALVAVQLVPFTQYLLQSPTVDGRQVHVFQSLRWAAVQGFPLAHGSPTMDFDGPFNFVYEFHEITILYVGFLALVLASIAVISPRWLPDRRPLFLGGLAVALVAFLYDLFGIGSLTSHIPGLSLLMPSRVAAVFALCIALLAGFGVDALRAPVPDPAETRRRRTVITVTALSVLVAAVFVYRAWHLFEYSVFSSAAVRRLARRTLFDHVAFVGVTLVIGLGCILVVAFRREPSIRRTAVGGLAVVVFLQGGFMLRGQNITSSDHQFMNFAPRVHQMAAHIGDNQTLWLDDARLMPDVNLWIPAYSPDNYDVIGIKAYEQFFRRSLRPPETLEVGGVQLGLLTGPYDPENTRALQAMGIRRLVTSSSYPFTVAGYLAARADKTRVDGGGLYTFRWRRDAPEQLVVSTSGFHPGDAIDATISGVGIRGEVHRTVAVHGGVGVVDLPRGLPDSGTMAVTYSWPATTAGAGSSGKILGTKIISTTTPGLILDASIGGFQIFRVPGPSGLVSSPAQFETAVSGVGALGRLFEPDFDPTKVAIVEGAPAPDARSNQDGQPGRVRVVRTDPARVTARVTRADPGYVVFNQNDYPGWRATVNGEDARIYRANSSYMAVAVPAGTSTVTFRFASNAVRFGAWLSIGTLALGVALVVSTFLRRGPRR